MANDRLITLAIHTFDKATEMREVLQQEGIPCELHNINLSSPEVGVGVRVRINESDLAKALLIVENYDIFTHEAAPRIQSDKILVPVDFLPRSMSATRVAMHVAARSHSEIEFLHAYLSPNRIDSRQLSDSYDFTTSDSDSAKVLRTEAEAQMARFVAAIKSDIKNGTLPPVKFSTIITEGIPEEAILNHTRRFKPLMVVMSTRDAIQKELDLIGSVSAEVLDGVRVPALTIPENLDPAHLSDIRHIVFLCNLDQEDILALDSLYRLMPDSAKHVSLVNVPPRRLRQTASDSNAQNLLDYCRRHYPDFTFSFENVSTHAVDDYMLSMRDKNPFQLLCVPNKRKNMFSRIFNPSLAHKLLFRADIPMMVLPV